MEGKINTFLLNSRKVVLESGAGRLYGVTGRRAAEQYRRNSDRFPAGSVFSASKEDWAILLPQIAASDDRILFVNHGRGGRRSAPLVFDALGVLALGLVLRSPEAQKACRCVPEAIRAMIVTMLAYPYLEKHLCSALEALEDGGGSAVKMAVFMLRKT